MFHLLRFCAHCRACVASRWHVGAPRILSRIVMIRWPFVHRQKCTQRHVLRWANFGPLAYDTDHDEAHKSGKFVAFNGSKLFEFQVISTGMTSWHRRVSDWNVTAVLMMSLEVINATFATASILWLVFRLVDWLFQVAGLDCLLYVCCMKDLQKGGHWLSTNLVHSNFLSSPLWSIARNTEIMMVHCVYLKSWRVAISHSSK